MVNLASKYLGSGSLVRPPLPPFVSATILQACWYSFWIMLLLHEYQMLAGGTL